MLLLALLLAAAPSEPQGGPAISADGERRNRAGRLLRMGRYLQVEEMLSSLPEPSALQRLQLAQALLGMGHCTESEAMLPQLTPAQQNGPLYQKLAGCYADHQQWHRAAAWLQMAEAQSSQLQPGQSAALWLMLSRAGEDRTAEAVAQRAEERAPAHDGIQLMRAKRAVDLGDVEAADAALWMLPERAQERPAVHLINAQLELDLGNLVAAEAHAKAALDGDELAAMALLAESRRRMGWPVGAAMALNRKPRLVAHHPQLRAVAIRLAVDQGELEIARELLRRGLDTGFADPELSASAWYLHRHSGQEAELWAQRWAAQNTSALRSLEQL